ncbi:MAG TPA: phosphoribosyltransferase family protein [Terriglobales bacterium]|nr:phosphoribosyltransferase family protein [Terriglobales bacterium]
MTQAGDVTVLLSAEQIQKRVQELARQISETYRGKTLHAVCVLDDAFVFMADLVRALDVPVVCQFVKPKLTEKSKDSGIHREIFFSPEIDVRGQHVLLVEVVVMSGITAEFLMRNLVGRGAATVKLCTLLDKQVSRRVSLQPDFFGFQVEEGFVVGYGLGAPHLGRNLPYVGVLKGAEGTAAASNK